MVLVGVLGSFMRALPSFIMEVLGVSTLPVRVLA
jgi:hypothetical protein